jgi:hypothetical protein
MKPKIKIIKTTHDARGDGRTVEHLTTLSDFFAVIYVHAVQAYNIAVILVMYVYIYIYIYYCYYELV